MEFQPIVCILRYMSSEVITLTKDNLIDYLDAKDLIVMFSSETCNACNVIKPYLKELPSGFKVVIVDCLRHLSSIRYFPGQIKYYPTLALFTNGYFVEELTQNQIITKQIY